MTLNTMKKRMSFLMLGLALLVSRAYADMGRVYTTPAKVSEEAQKAIILHNMHEEVLILGTDMRADKETGVVRFIPFPSEPKVGLAPAGVFESVARMMERHRVRFRYAVSKGSSFARTSGVVLKVHEKLGEHDVTVIKVNNTSQFRRWVNRFFERRGLPARKRYPGIEGIVEDYVKRGLNYFVFDYVVVPKRTCFIQPLIYRFKSGDVYYPLKTSNTFGGSGEIDLIFITPKVLCIPSTAGYDRPKLLGSPEHSMASTAERITVGEVKEIYPDARDFFGKMKICIQMVSFHGKYRFKNDLFQDPTKGFDLRPMTTNYEVYGSRGQVSRWNRRRFHERVGSRLGREMEGDLRFGLGLYRSVSADYQGRNLLISPFSLYTALAMTYAGARGDTETQMACTLHFPPRNELPQDFFGLLQSLNKPPCKGCNLVICNALWGQTGHKFNTDFLKVTDKHYEGGFKRVDFLGRTQESRRTINEWVEKSTFGKIRNLLGRNDVTKGTRLVLTNAIYFKGEWDSPFKKEMTKVRPFYVTPDVKVEARMMRQTGMFRWADEGNLQVLELPYKANGNGSCFMVILLPKKRLQDLESELTADHLHRWLSDMSDTEVDVSVPRFTFNAGYYLQDALATMGMPDAFDRLAANFSGVDGRRDLYISRVVHRADIDVAEEGTEASAGSAVEMRETCVPGYKVFRADHPFIFLIEDWPTELTMDSRTGVLLFVGRVINPK